MKMRMQVLVLGMCLMAGIAWAQAKLVESPAEMQVFQRNSRDKADVRIAGTVPAGAGLVEVKAELEKNLRGKAVDWTVVAKANAIMDGKFSGSIRLRTGGWYTLRVRFRKSASDKAVLQEVVISKVGVGDIFVVAGQSNSANWGEERLKPKTGLVVNFTGSKWQVADDPQPGAGGGGGSFIPPFGDAMAGKFRMPVGFITCGIGATSVRDWLSKGTTFTNPPTLKQNVAKISEDLWACNGNAFNMFVTRMRSLGTNGFRAVLWHQGESDANQPDPKCTISGDLYRKYLEQLIRESRKEIGWEAPWFVAQVSYHVPGDESSAEIRAGQKSLWDDKVAHEGPDTDALKSEYRERGGQGVHLNGKGLREHGARWAEKVGAWLEKGGK